MPKDITLPIKYFSQRDNLNRPGGTCNLTSLAMAMNALGLAGNGDGQIEDQLFRYAADRGIDYQSVDGIARICNEVGKPLGIIDRPHTDAKLSDIIEALEKGHYVIVHGYSTAPGHIFVINGIRFKKDGGIMFLVQDPWGEWFPHYYQATSGKDLLYSDRMVFSCCVAHSHREAINRYDRGPTKQEMDTMGGMWIHRIFKG